MTHISKLILSLPILWLFTGFLIIPGSDKIIVPITIISIIFSIIIYKTKLLIENISSHLSIIILLILIYGIISYYTHGFSSNEIRVLLVAWLYFLFVPKDLIKKHHLIILISLASIISLTYLYYNSVINGVIRGSYPFNPIPYSSILAVYGTYSLYVALFEKNKITIIPYTFFFIGLFITETRGTILALCLSTLYLISCKTLELIKTKNKKQITYYVTTIALMVGLISFSINKPLENRYQQTLYEVQEIESGNFNTSIGLRLQMWRAALEMSSRNIFLGAGDNHAIYLEEMYNEGKASKVLFQYSPTHYHNQYLDKLVKTGIIGLILFLLLQLSLLKIVNTNNKHTRKMAISLTISFIIISLTDTPFGQGISLLSITMLLYLLTNAYSSIDDKP